MIVIDGLYIAFYRLSLFFRENVPGSFFYNKRFDSIMMLSIFTTLNIASVFMLFDGNSLLGKPLADFFVCVVLTAGVFTICFERKARYRVILERYKSKSFVLYGVTYCIISVTIFIYLHSRL